MNPLQDVKVLNILPPSTIHDNVAPATTEVDSLGFDYAQFYVFLGATDIGVTVLNVGHGSTVAGASTGEVIAKTNFASTAGITSIDGTTLVLPNSTNDNKVFGIAVDLKDKERYLDLNITIGDGSAGGYYSACCILSRAAQAPITSTGRGCIQVARA